ncbi:MAG TPA: TIGR03557 family F420-dependent LLM class oxidoreductase [Acidimicrobiales bacterium]|nr:TIGR03557 family F420-dependent LLM class oxidoreductase [Acidimicrobiales bacterium]
MTVFGYTLSSEEHGPADLVRYAVEAEDAGFSFLSASDHFHPWVGKQGHSPFVWSVLGAVASSTSTIDLAVGVTCPIVRIHPAIIAQAAATTSVLSEGRFTLGLGTGEALNEHVTGESWPPAPVRLDMLREAVVIIRRLLTGETVDHHGTHFTVENARLFDAPDEGPAIILSAFGTNAAKMAGHLGDGVWGTAADAATVETFRDAGGSGPRYTQITVCWDSDQERARRTMQEQWPNGAMPGQLSQDLPTWVHFEQLAELARSGSDPTSVPCGPDPEPFVEAARAAEKAGFDHIYFHQVGADQPGFLKFWQNELGAALT